VVVDRKAITFIVNYRAGVPGGAVAFIAMA